MLNSLIVSKNISTESKCQPFWLATKMHFHKNEIDFFVVAMQWFYIAIKHKTLLFKVWISNQINTNLPIQIGWRLLLSVASWLLRGRNVCDVDISALGKCFSVLYRSGKNDYTTNNLKLMILETMKLRWM